MAAAVLALSGFAIVFLGADTPIQDIAQTARDVSPAAVVISVSAAADSERTAEDLRDLRRRVDSSFEVVVGGSGAESMDGVTRIGGFRALGEWVRRGALT